MTTPKLAVLARSFPPVIAGSTVLMNNLFQDYHHPIEGIIGRHFNYTNEAFKAPCEARYLKLPFQRLEDVMFKYPFLFRPLVKQFIRKNLKEIKPKVAYIAYPPGYYLAYAAEVCQELNIPYIVHMHDLWEENIPADKFEGKLARKKEVKILKSAAKLLCMTTTQQEFYKQKHGLDSFYLPHTIPTKRLNLIRNTAFNYNPNPKKKILYSGSIDRLINRDAIQQFVKAIDYLPEEFEITMLMRSDIEGLKQLDLYHPRVKYDWVNPDQAFVLQQESDLLFLPLSINNCSREEVRTVFATKTLDYLVSGTPIFCVAPADSFHSIDAKQKNWATVINTDDPKSIASGIIALLNNESACKSNVDNAFKEAHSRSSAIYSENLFQLINSL